MNERMNGWMMVSQFYGRGRGFRVQAEGVRVVNVEQRNSAVGREFQILAFALSL